MVHIFKEQQYDKIRKHHQELGVPWTDPTFPANDSSIGLGKSRELRGVEWRRPADLSANAQFVIDGFGRHDVVQGKLGNCWFVAAASVLAGVPPLWQKVVPDHKDQEWIGEKKEKYGGIFRFQFWQFGKWVEVCIDDLIPTREGVPIFTYSTNGDEFWGALLEKAYAKLHGSYDALDGGNLSDALVDFTGGVSELISLHTESEGHKFNEETKKNELFSRVQREVSEHALVCCAIRPIDGEKEQRTDMGLVRGHAYGITAVKKLPISGTGLVAFFKGREKVALVRLRNPWGQKEWTGAFSDSSIEWKNVSPREKEKLGLTTEDDGEFWMPWDDFVQHFTDLSIVHLINTSHFSFSKTWHEYTRTDSWTKPERAGGCLNHPATFLLNPQFRFDVGGKGDEEVVIQLSQNYNQALQILPSKDKLVIGFHMMKVESNREFRVHQQRPGAGTSDYIRSRHIFLRTILQPGRYVVTPTAFNPGEEGRFLVRLFTNKTSGLIPLERDGPSDPPCMACGCGRRPKVVTRLTVISAEGLQKNDIVGKADPYVYLTCEGLKKKSAHVADSLSPRWDYSVLFYRCKPDKPIKIQIWNHNVLKDTFMGQCVVDAKESGDPDNPFGEEAARNVRTLELFEKKKENAERVPGTVKVTIETFKDLEAV